MSLMKSKALTLQNLTGKVQKGQILPLVIFNYTDLEEFDDIYVEIVKRCGGSNEVIVRSSCSKEDQVSISNAGYFTSIDHVPLTDKKALYSALVSVFESYRKCQDLQIEKEHALIQPHLTNIAMAGVVFTADQETRAPYYIINYDESGSTNSVTAGATNSVRSLVHYKSHKKYPCQKIEAIIHLAEEIESLTGNSFLDIEFAITKDNQIYLFQVRPLNVSVAIDISEESMDLCLYKVEQKLEKFFCKHPNLLGDHGLLGVMPDWNPAEIIGLKPKKLALTLYKEIITDGVWAFQRHNYGYRNLRSHPLMLSVMGVPYIDVRVDFNSFIPSDLDEKIASKLANFYLEKLKRNPHFHDKVEFEVVYSCYDCSLPNRLALLLNAGFSAEEVRQISDSLMRLTRKVIDPAHGLYLQDIVKIHELRDRCKAIQDSDLPLIDRIYWLLEYVKRYGTLPFAGVARSSFIAVQMLKSFLDAKIISDNDFHNYMMSLNTISKQLKTDTDLFIRGEIDRIFFSSKYGHLRPGTYDITSKRYDKDFEFYFQKPHANASNVPNLSRNEFTHTESQKRKIEDFFSSIELPISSDQFFEFCKVTIEGRESVKFLFTKILSDILQLITDLGAKYDISPEELQHLDIRIISDLYSSLDFDNVDYTLKTNIEKNKRNYEYTSIVRMPSLISNKNDIYSFEMDFEQPNFITQKSIIANAINELDMKTSDLENKIVLISSADPGYDFLFLKNISGLITKFGGANSHMAIRCAELGIPAVIGAGEKKFQDWSQARMLKVDCAHKIVEVIH